jgi:hypothetical protein
MKTNLVVLCVLILCVADDAAAQDRAVRRVAEPVANRYIVVLAGDDDPLAAGLQSQAIHGGRLTHVYEHAIHGFAMQLTPAAASALARDPRVSYVEEDGIVRATDTQIAPPWGLDRIDQRTLPLTGAYNYPPAGPAVFVHVIDTGIRPTHVEFGGRAFIAGDFVDDDRDGDPGDVGNDDGNPSQPDGADCSGHGTHVAGTIGGETYGVAKNATLIAYRALDCSGNGRLSSVIAALDRVTADPRRPAVANMSLGGGTSTALDDAVRRSIAAGVTYVLSAGNSDINAALTSPARVVEAITVAASNANDVRATFSNFGAVIDLFAPGVSVRSAYYTSDTATAVFSGTSMSSPHVAGVAALFLQAFGDQSPAQVRNALVNNATASVIVDPAGSPNRLLNSEFLLAPPLPPPSGTNAALAGNGAIASASSQHAPGWQPAAANNGDRRGVNIGAGGVWGDGTNSVFPDWLQIDFSASYAIDRIDVFTKQDAAQSPVEPTPEMTFTKGGITAFQVQYWTGSGWATVPGGSVTGNLSVWRTFTFAPITTSRIRVVVNGSSGAFSFIAEVEAYGTKAAAPPAGVNVALASNGALASASSLHAIGWEASAINNGDRRGLNIGAGGVWGDGTRSAFPDWVRVDFAASATIGRINVFTKQDTAQAPLEPTPDMAFSNGGVTVFQVQYWTGAAWATVPGGSVTGNSNVWRTFTFAPITTSRIRVLINGSLSPFAFITEVEAFTN